jgi:hypothetical protein
MSKPIYFKLGSTGKIYQADSCRDFRIGLDGGSLILVVHFFNECNLDSAIKTHQYFNRVHSNRGASLYLVIEGDMLFESIKDTRLARKMFPDAIKHKGWLLIESK